MRSSLTAGLICVLGILLGSAAAHALQFGLTPIFATDVIIGGRGPIVPGDTARLEQALAAVPRDKRVVALALDSPGGNVVEGEQLAHLVRARLLTVVIPANSQCVSACFLVLAASPRRMAASDALVGVHSANEGGRETDTSLAVTTLMARVAGEMGIPPAIIGKMVETTARRVTWLTPEELASMDVTVYQTGIAAALHQAAVAVATQIGPGQTAAGTRPAPSRSNAPAAPPPPLQAMAVPQGPAADRPAGLPPGFADGRNDRLAWMAWFAGLHGDYRSGAAAALAQLRQPGSCYGPNGANRGDFTLGCVIGLQRLAPVGLRLRGNANYAAGWNASGLAQSGAGNAPGAEYRGAYFCGRHVARLTLTLFPSSGEPHRRAVLGFGPLPTNPDVPHGAFIVEGFINPDGGALTLSPVKWVMQPAGYGWLGLAGSSDDGGRTFSGRVLDPANQCTTFTLSRIGAPPHR